MEGRIASYSNSVSRYYTSGANRAAQGGLEDRADPSRRAGQHEDPPAE